MYVINPLSAETTTVPSNIYTTWDGETSQNILKQLQQAFLKPPTKANLLIGERRIHQGSKGRRTALFPSRKCAGSLPMESRLELAHALCLEGSPNVIDYRTQAVCIYLSGGQSYYPDFLVRTKHGGYEIHEVKPDANYLKDATKHKLKLLENLLKRIDVSLKIIDASQLPNERKVESLLQLYSRGHTRQWTPQQISLGCDLLNINEPTSLACGYSILEANDLPTYLLDYFLFHGHLRIVDSKNNLFTVGDSK